jgi:hypothetical protein
VIHAGGSQVRRVQIQPFGRATQRVQGPPHPDATRRLNLAKVVPLLDGSGGGSRVSGAREQRSENSRDARKQGSSDTAPDARLPRVRRARETDSMLKRGLHRGRP